MSDRYNPFPIAGPLQDGDKLYFGAYETKAGNPVPGSFVYVTYDASSGKIVGNSPKSYSADGTPVFDSYIVLPIFTYEKGNNSTAAFSTEVTGEVRYLHTGTTDSNAPSTLSTVKSYYFTQALPDLWAGYFEYFFLSNNPDYWMTIDMSNVTSYVTAIPTTVYTPTACGSIDNSRGQALSSLITSFMKNTNSTIYYTNSADCNSNNVVNYCQNQWSSPAVIGKDIYTCNDPIPTNPDAGITNCMGICSSFTLQNNPLCYPQTDGTFACQNFKKNVQGDDTGKPIYAQTWFIILMVVIALLVLAIIVVAIFKSRG